MPNMNDLFAKAPAYAGGGYVPASNFGMGGGGGGDFNPMMFATGMGGMLGGLFGDSGAPYEDAMKQYQEWANKAQGVQQPFLDAGMRGMGNFENWLGGMKNPSGFMNNLMGQYQQSPYANYLQQQSMRAGENAASASGLMGSTPFMQQMQANAGNIASGDMNQWLQNVLGINTQYGAGQQSLMQGGQGAANALTGMYGQMGNNMAEAAYGQKAGKNQDFMNTIGGIAQIGSMFL